MNMLQSLSPIKMFIVVVLLTAYSASMYKIASSQVLQTGTVDMSISGPTAADAKKIRAVVKPRVEGQGSTMYLPGVACVIEAGPDVTVEMMEEYFSTCVSEHHIFTTGSEIVVLE